MVRNNKVFNCLSRSIGILIPNNLSAKDNKNKPQKAVFVFKEGRMSSMSYGQRQETRQTSTIIGSSKYTVRMREFAERAAQTEHNILLRGENGTGKDHLAEAIHHLARGRQQFVTVDCGAQPETLSESELFGHTRGSFTDARADRQGLVQVAERGTLFFNEVANMSLSHQAKFLRVLEKRPYRQVGGNKEYAVNTQIIAATNVNLEEAVQRGDLRVDLYHRLSTISFTVVPLRDRKEDIPELAHYFLRRENASREFTPEAISALVDYNWPGNVRELQNAIIRAVFYSAADGEIRPDHIHPYLTGVGKSGAPTFEQVQVEYLSDLLRRTKGSSPRPQN